MMSRRQFLAGTAIAALGLMLNPSFSRKAFAQEKKVDVAELMKPGPMPEKTLGDPKAKVTIVEYASMTCSHCADFHETTYPVLKEKYIDTGKVYFVFREFPLDPLAAAGFMLARNAPGDTFFDVVDTLFKRQADWVFVEQPVPALRDLAKQFGYSPQSFEDTLSNQKLLDDINAVRSRAVDVFGVNSTPTFFINGVMVSGSFTPEELAAKVDPLLAG